MQPNDEARYRLRLAEGFLEEARQDIDSKRWRSCMDNGQLAVENAAKAILALLGPIGHTHNPGTLLYQAIADNRFPQELHARIVRLAECATLLGPAVHFQSDYGDEAGRRTPWEIFGEADAQQALKLAKDSLRIAREFVR